MHIHTSWRPLPCILPVSCYASLQSGQTTTYLSPLPLPFATTLIPLFPSFPPLLLQSTLLSERSKVIALFPFTCHKRNKCAKIKRHVQKSLKIQVQNFTSFRIRLINVCVLYITIKLKIILCCQDLRCFNKGTEMSKISVTHLHKNGTYSPSLFRRINLCQYIL